MRPSFLRKTGAISCTVLSCSKSLLDHRLALVGLQHLGWRHSAIVGDQRIHAVALVLVGDGLLIDRPFDVEASLDDLAIGRLEARSAGPCLLVEVVFATVRSTLR
jgi:hypothetical protein